MFGLPWNCSYKSHNANETSDNGEKKGGVATTRRHRTKKQIEKGMMKALVGRIATSPITMQTGISTAQIIHSHTGITTHGGDEFSFYKKRLGKQDGK